MWLIFESARSHACTHPLVRKLALLKQTFKVKLGLLGATLVVLTQSM